jgi:hypothetical protein
MDESLFLQKPRQFLIQAFVPFRIHEFPTRVASRDDHKYLRPTSPRFNSMKNSLQESRSFIGGERNLIHDARSNLVSIGRAFRSRREQREQFQKGGRIHGTHLTDSYSEVNLNNNGSRIMPRGGAISRGGKITDWR